MVNNCTTPGQTKYENMQTKYENMSTRKKATVRHNILFSIPWSMIIAWIGGEGAPAEQRPAPISSINSPSTRAPGMGPTVTVDIGSRSINSLVNVMDSLVISINYPSARPPGMKPTLLTLGAWLLVISINSLVISSQRVFVILVKFSLFKGRMGLTVTVDIGSLSNHKFSCDCNGFSQNFYKFSRDFYKFSHDFHKSSCDYLRFSLCKGRWGWGQQCWHWELSSFGSPLPRRLFLWPG